jgi:predicted alpha/beta-fold hydrolase
MNRAPEQFSPAMGMANPHVQTILSSVARKVLPPKDQSAFNATAVREVISVDGARLAVDFNIQPGRPLIIIIPGWLGSANSSYVLSSATELAKAGYSTARINLRDHGDTAHLNEGMFNSALIDEVVALVNNLTAQYGAAGSGLLGYSLGGNFALRVARALPGLSTLAICPAIAPGATMYRIDRSAVYQRYFVQKWRKVWREKQMAFPGTYDFGGALKLNTVGALTDYFVRYHSDFPSTAEYFQAYDLSMHALHGVEAHILAANDDPIIPVSQYDDLPDSLTLHMTPRGGHGGYLDSWRLSSWADKYAIQHFNRTLTS